MAYTRVIAGDDSSPEQMNVLYDSMEKLEAISAEATTLTPESNATAVVETDGSGNKKLVVGLPQGATGSAGTNGADGKSYRPMGVWSSTPTYINDSQYIDTVLGADGNQYYCKVSNTNVSTSNTTYWGILAQKGADGTGAGNLYGNNITAADGIVTTKTYGIQPTAPLPAEGGTLAGNLVEVAAMEDINRKVEKDFTNVYAEKITLVDNDLIIIQDSADTSSPKLNKRVKIGSLKTVKVNSAIAADSAANSVLINNINLRDVSNVLTADTYTVEKKELIYNTASTISAGLQYYTGLTLISGKTIANEDALEIHSQVTNSSTEQFISRIHICDGTPVNDISTVKSPYIYNFTAYRQSNTIINFESATKRDLSNGAVTGVDLIINKIYKIIGG